MYYLRLRKHYMRKENGHILRFYNIPVKKIRGIFLFCFIIFIHFSSWSLFAQYESLLHKPYGSNVLGIHAMYSDLINVRDSTLRAQKAEEIKIFARKHNDRGLELNVDFFLVFWNAFYQNQPKKISHKKLTEQLELVWEENTDFLRLRALRALAEFYWKKEKNYELAFEQYLLLNKELTITKAEDYPEMARDLMQIGEAYYFFRDYDLAIKYFKRSAALPENNFNTMVINAAKNNLGLCYQQQNKLDSSDYYFEQMMTTVFPEAVVWKRIATGNIGTNQYLRLQYDKAIPLLETDFYGAIAENDFGCAAGAAITLADIYQIRGDIKKAKLFIEKGLYYTGKANQSERLRLLYPVMSKWYTATGDSENARRYVDSSVTALNRYNEKFSALKVLRAKQKVDIQEEQLRQAATVLERERKTAERNLLILLILLLCIAISLTYFIQKKRQLIRDLKLERSSRELETAKLKLKGFTESLQEKNNLIEELELQLDKNAGANILIMQQLRQSTILTEDDWQSFQRLFDKAYPGFISRLKEKYEELSIGEVRYFVLFKLNLSTKEMAGMLGISPNAIQVMGHRIRKKFNISDNIHVKELIKTI